MTRALLLLLALLCALPLPAEAARRKKKAVKRSPAPAAAPVRPAQRPTRTRGRVAVTYVTAQRAYLDRGIEDGLAVGQALKFTRNGRNAGTCTIDTAAPGSATCTGAGLRIGDSAPAEFTVAQKPAPAPLPEPPSPAELRELRARVLDAKTPFVESEAQKATSPALAQLRLDAELAHQSWVTVSSDDAAYHQERLDVAVRGMPLFGGTRLYVDATAAQWTGRPQEFLSPHRSASQLYVRELAVTRREPGGGLVFSAGRVWPYRAASLGLFDGAQLGWESADGTWEAGAFAGAVPSALNTAPDLTRPLLGAYAAYTHRSSEGALRWFQQELHLGVEPSSAPGLRVEVESVSRAWFSQKADAGLDVRVAQGPPGTELLQAARLDLGLRPSDALRVSASGRYDATPVEVLPSVTATPLGHRALRADGSVTWDATSRLSVGLSAGHANDLETRVDRTWVGPQVGAPRLLGGALSLWAGYEEELGWLRGRSAWVMTAVRPSPRLDLMLRASWTQTAPDVDVGAWSEQEVGGWASVRYALSRTFQVRASVLARMGLPGGEEDQTALPFGLTAAASVAGAF